MAGRIIPKKITQLSRCEIFVFGSNPEGHHNGSAARMAYKKFGAEWGVGSGPTGQCYAIPTMFDSVEDIKPYVDEFTEYAKNHPNNRFLVTRIGCGIAGFDDKDIAPLFREAFKLPNVNVDREWILILTHDEFVDAVMFGIIPEEKVVPVANAISEEDLIELTGKYRYIIGSGVKAPLPKIRVRYVIDQDQFEYADFGKFILLPNGEMYVFDRDCEFEGLHNPDVLFSYFGDECAGRGYLHRVIFAGVETPYRDCNGESIYTGDVIDLPDRGMQLALSTLGSNSDGWNKRYAFVLDNHCIWPEECKQMRRIGTVFYQLDEYDIRTVAQRCFDFQGICQGGISREDALLMSKFTPNFDSEIWKYFALDAIGVVFSWNKPHKYSKNKKSPKVMNSEKTIQDYLRGKDPEFDNTDPKEIKLVRHADSRTKGAKGNSKKKELVIHSNPFPSNIRDLHSLYMYRKDLFLEYQGEQLKNTFKGIKYIVTFLGETGTTSRFVGVYKIEGSTPSPYDPEEVLLDLKPVEAFIPLEEKYVIDWGRATTSWHQYYYNLKPVIGIEDKLSRDIHLPKAQLYKDAVLSYPQLKQAVQNPEWVDILKTVNCIYAILDNNNGKLYVGSTYNTDGILGRWESYAKTGHGDDKELNALIAKDPSYATDNFQWTILEILPLDIPADMAVEREKIWKIKLGTGKHGYTNN